MVDIYREPQCGCLETHSVTWRFWVSLNEGCKWGYLESQVILILHWCSSRNCTNEYLSVDSGGYVYEQPSRINCSVPGCFPEKLRWYLIEQVCGEVKCKALWAILRTGNCTISELIFTLLYPPHSTTARSARRQESATVRQRRVSCFKRYSTHNDPHINTTFANIYGSKHHDVIQNRRTLLSTACPQSPFNVWCCQFRVLYDIHTCSFGPIIVLI